MPVLLQLWWHHKNWATVTFVFALASRMQCLHMQCQKRKFRLHFKLYHQCTKHNQRLSVCCMYYMPPVRPLMYLLAITAAGPEWSNNPSDSNIHGFNKSLQTVTLQLQKYGQQLMTTPSTPTTETQRGRNREWERESFGWLFYDTRWHSEYVLVDDVHDKPLTVKSSHCKHCAGVQVRHTSGQCKHDSTRWRRTWTHRPSWTDEQLVMAEGCQCQNWTVYCHMLHQVILNS